MGTDLAGVRDTGRHAVRGGPVLRAAHGRGALSLGLIASGCALAQPGASAGLASIARSALCVTEGSVSEVPGGHGRRLTVDVPSMRAYANQASADHALLHATYLGPTATRAALGSGAVRVQFGLKLRAADPCNLVYVMWRIEPQARLVVSVKSNPGQHSSAQCGDRGYRNIAPQSSAAIPALSAGQSHLLAADLTADQLRVSVDGAGVWFGHLGATAAAFTGPPGVRSDNARLEFELSADTALAAAPTSVCRSGPGESE